MAFDSKDTAAFKGVWVFCEQREGVIMSTSYQLLSEGRKLANDLGVELCGVVLGKDIKEDYLKALGGYGADKVYYCNHELLDVYTTDAYTKVICDLVEDKKPEIDQLTSTSVILVRAWAGIYSCTPWKFTPPVHRLGQGRPM